MKSLDPDLQAHLDTGVTTLALCWRIERSDGTVFGFTEHDRPLVFGGTEYEPETGFTASDIRVQAGLAVDSQDVEGALRSDRITETDILDGRWDNASVEVWLVNWEDTGRRVLLRRGSIGEIRRGAHSFMAEVRSLAHVLNQPVGRTYQYACDAELGDARCGVDTSSTLYRGTGTVASVDGDRAFLSAPGLEAFPEGWFYLGALEWTSGANAGRVAVVADHAVTAGVVRLSLFEGPVRAVAPGDGFVVIAGCDKLHATCRDRFGNVVNFRGFPSIPGDDVISRYPGADGGNDGRPLRPLADG